MTIIKSPPIQLATWTLLNRSPMNIEQFTTYTNALARNSERPRVSSIFLHHTWRPTPDTWAGYDTILAMKAYYERQPWTDEYGRQHEGWTAGPHLFIAPDGIWLFTDLLRDGVGVAEHNENTRHVEMVGNYDTNPPSGDILAYTVAALALLHRAFDLPPEALRFHSDCSPKTCPGAAVSKTAMIEKVRAWLDQHPATPTPGLTHTLRSTAYDLLHIPYNPSNALARYALLHHLGAPLADEYELTHGGTLYVAQPFAAGLAYCPKGRWEQCTHLEW